MRKHSWFKFNVSRWLGDQHLVLAGSTARGVLIDLMAIAHDGVPYGYVTNGGLPITDTELARSRRERVTTVHRAVLKLIELGRVGRTAEGILYIPAMVRDAEQHQKHVEHGSMGGNPKLLEKGQAGVKPGVKPGVKAE